MHSKYYDMHSGRRTSPLLHAANPKDTRCTCVMTTGRDEVGPASSAVGFS